MSLVVETKYDTHTRKEQTIELFLISARLADFILAPVTTVLLKRRRIPSICYQNLATTDYEFFLFGTVLAATVEMRAFLIVFDKLQASHKPSQTDSPIYFASFSSFHHARSVSSFKLLNDSFIEIKCTVPDRCDVTKLISDVKYHHLMSGVSN